MRSAYVAVSVINTNTMLISVDTIKPHLAGLHITGVLHVGAHECEEIPVYTELGISAENTIWIDAQASKVQEAVARGIPNVFHGAMGDTDGKSVTLNITNNSQSSSILELGTHAVYYPQIVNVCAVAMETTTIDTFMETHGFNAAVHNFWNLDIQGAELLVLRGGAKSLQLAQAVYVEVNTEYVYKDCALLEELDTFLADAGLFRVLICMTTAGWGDALYVRKCVHAAAAAAAAE